MHDCMENNAVCKDCMEHVKHNAHISQSSIMDFDCVLCKIIHTDYITPEVLVFLTAALLAFSLPTCVIQKTMRRKAVLPSLRAPPVVSYYR